jgi:hypothetical protein
MNNLEIHLVGCHYPGKVVKVTTEYLDSDETKKYIAKLSDVSKRPTVDIISDISFHRYIIVPDYSKPPVKHDTPQSLEGIFQSFCKLDPYNKEDDFKDFISRNGLLGIWEPPPFQILNFMGEIKYCDKAKHGTFVYEPLKLWVKHIEIARELFKIYSTLIRSKKYGNRHIQVDRVPAPTEIKNGRGYFYRLGNQLVLINEAEFEKPEKTAIEILGQCLQKVLRGGINIDYTNFVSNPKSNIGYSFIPTYSTPYLIAAIYFTLWKMVNTQESAYTCDYCGNPIDNISKGRIKRYCNGNCRQYDNRQRKRKEGE